MIFEILKRVLENLVAYGKRSMMTVLGITWGIASFILLMAYGDGFQRAMMLGLKYFGDNVVVVWNGQTSMQAGGSRAGRVVQTKPEDVEMIRQRCTLVKRVSPEVYRDMQLRWGDRLTTPGVRAVNDEYGAIRGHVHGRGPIHHTRGHRVHAPRRRARVRPEEEGLQPGARGRPGRLPQRRAVHRRRRAQEKDRDLELFHPGRQLRDHPDQRDGDDGGHHAQQRAGVSAGGGSDGGTRQSGRSPGPRRDPQVQPRRREGAAFSEVQHGFRHHQRADDGDKRPAGRHRAVHARGGRASGS